MFTAGRPDHRPEIRSLGNKKEEPEYRPMLPVVITTSCSNTAVFPSHIYYLATALGDRMEMIGSMSRIMAISPCEAIVVCTRGTRCDPLANGICLHHLTSTKRV